MSLVKYRIVFATAKSKAHAKLVREPLLLNLTPMKRTVQEDVEATVSPLNDFESRGRFLSRAESLRVLLTSHLVDDGTASFMSTGSFTAGLHPNRGCVIGYTALGNLLSDKNENSATLVVKYRIPEGALFSIFLSLSLGDFPGSNSAIISVFSHLARHRVPSATRSRTPHTLSLRGSLGVVRWRGVARLRLRLSSPSLASALETTARTSGC
jgi:hypothetical protein